ncbi:MAG: glycoside hydrolase family 1 protein [Chloroflexi bacterium]|nr:glycoside hydrolase family 1 protein [Chloroflexota bacterium]
MAEATHHFPSDFEWGTATSAHQVEGDNSNNDWWEWEQRKNGKVHGDVSSAKACDWWAGRAEEDIQRMAELKTSTHRLSIEWSRLEPEPGQFDNAAFDRYREIIKTMRSAGITPLVTLHHFTTPIWVAAQGGWLQSDAPKTFAAFVERAVGNLSDLVDRWCTINEPNVYSTNSFFLGGWPPGKAGINDYYAALFNLLEAHARSYDIIHDQQPNAQVGLAKHMVYYHPRSISPLDGQVNRIVDRQFNGITLTALAKGRWEPLVGKKVGVDKWRNTLDWIGLNYYMRHNTFFDVSNLSGLGIGYGPRPAEEHGPGGWGEFYPDGLFECIKRLHRSLNLPIYITENGLPDERDRKRPRIMLEYIRRVWTAVMHNYPVKGYYYWSLLDNFEWAEGYDPEFRFGLYEVDFETQERTLKPSGELYGKIAESNSISSEMVRKSAPEAMDSLFPGGLGGS